MKVNYNLSKLSVEFDGEMLSFNLSAPENWYGLDTLGVIVSDGELADSALIIVEVKSVNDAPFFVDLPDTVEIVVDMEENMPKEEDERVCAGCNFQKVCED